MISEKAWQQWQNDAPNCSTLIVAYSGGLDSHVLLLSLLETKPENIRLEAVHVHHGLQKDNDAWVEHCRQICRELNVVLHVEYVTVSRNLGESKEAAAREARYHAFSRYQSPSTCLVTAHHGDDQVETVLLQLFRGSGVRGLSAMPDLSIDPFHWRPLLAYERADLLAFAHERRLNWVEDASNQNQAFSRNFLRHEIIPRLKSHWPGLTQALTRSAHLQQEAEVLLQEQAERDFTLCRSQQDGCLCVSQLRTLSTPRLHNVLRFWIRQQHLPMPSQAKLLQIQHDALTAHEDRMPLITWPGAEVRRYRDDLYAMPPLVDIPSSLSVPWVDRSQALVLPYGLGIMEPADWDIPLSAFIEMRLPEPGLKFRCQGRVGTKNIKKWCQEWGIPPWQRDRIPLLYIDNRLAFVVGFAQII